MKFSAARSWPGIANSVLAGQRWLMSLNRNTRSVVERQIDVTICAHVCRNLSDHRVRNVSRFSKNAVTRETRRTNARFSGSAGFSSPRASLPPASRTSRENTTCPSILLRSPSTSRMSPTPLSQGEFDDYFGM